MFPPQNCTTVRKRLRTKTASLGYMSKERPTVQVVDVVDCILRSAMVKSAEFMRLGLGSKDLYDPCHAFERELNRRLVSRVAYRSGAKEVMEVLNQGADVNAEDEDDTWPATLHAIMETLLIVLLLPATPRNLAEQCTYFNCSYCGALLCSKGVRKMRMHLIRFSQEKLTTQSM
eukprot:gnl/MRDRNA2_/MRDRNA2_56418_c0_seq1.p1 gnl/MRDRNA2_/MRDRNA2_56418_c0~~gnl/MRDRNA2_/MRDRNA2_56418_c0_seq1.p1  ORF type:complete len:174 (-),score=29.19 gnl/MRDRNA2_/MRDRNA2_56418_c0_seq1:192-713(-)